MFHRLSLRVILKYIEKLLKNIAWQMLFLLQPLLARFFPRVDFNSRWFTQKPIGYLWCVRAIWQRNVLRLARPMPWPCALTCTVSNPDKIQFHSDDLNNFQSPGTYYQCHGGNIVLSRGCYIAPNVGIITTNHDLDDLSANQPSKDVFVGNSVWIGMNAVILPGVRLADRTIVGAGAVVTKSNSHPGQILTGVPACPRNRP